MPTGRKERQGTLAPVLLILIAAAAGALLTYSFDGGMRPSARLAAGAPLGLTLLGLAGFSLASRWGLNPATLTLAAGATALPLLALASPPRRAAVGADLLRSLDVLARFAARPRRLQVAVSAYWALAAALLWGLFARVLYAAPDGGLYTGAVNDLGDLPFHLGIIAGFAQGHNFPPQHPEMAGVRLTYHFLADFVAAMLVRAGAAPADALFLENYVLALSLAALLHRWAWALTRDRLAALLTPPLVLLSGGLGWWLLLGDARRTDRGLLSLIAAPPHDYTIQVPQDPGLRWGNALTALLLPERALLLGLPLALVVCTLWWQATDGRGDGGRAAPARRMLAAGAVLGLLPLAQAQCFAALLGVGCCAALLTRRWRLWLPSLALAAALAAPQLLWLLRGGAAHGRGLLAWHWGWEGGGAGFGWAGFAGFWLRNTGLFIPLLLAALLWRGLVPPRLRLFYLPFTLCFLVPNALRLEPWVWDTIKILFLWFVASSPLVALLLARLWRRPPPGWRPALSRAAAAAALASLTLAGGLDVWRTASGMTSYREFDAGGLALAALVERATPPAAVVLGAPTYNDPVLLTGRHALLGYAGHLWSQGIDCAARGDAVRRVYAGAPDAQALLDRYRVQYVVVGPLERATLPVSGAFFQTLPRAGEAGGYVLYKNPHL